MHMKLVGSGNVLSRSKLEIDQDLSLTLQKIRATIGERLGWLNIVSPISRKLIQECRQEPGKALLKASCCAGIGYISYLLIRGSFAGVEVDIDSNFANVFSSQKNVRLNEGLNLTNGDQAGQFMIDTAVIAVISFRLVFRKPYYAYASEVINEAYETHIGDLLSSIEAIETQLSQRDVADDDLTGRLARCRENLNRLYKRLEKELKPYQGEPTFKNSSQESDEIELREVVDSV